MLIVSHKNDRFVYYMLQNKLCRTVYTLRKFHNTFTCRINWQKTKGDSTVWTNWENITEVAAKELLERYGEK